MKLQPVRLARAAWFRMRQPLTRAFAQLPAPPRVAAKAVYCLETGKGRGLLAKNEHYRFAPASTIKLLTAMLFLDDPSTDLQRDVLVVDQDCVRGSKMGLRPGDVVTGRDLLFGLLVPSGNDAAQAIARICGDAMLAREGGRGDPVARFVAEMNKRADALGMRASRFANPSGLDVAGQYSTAHDIARLGAAAFARPLVRTACAARTYTAQSRGDHPRTTELKSTVAWDDLQQFTCGKTGSSVNAGACFVARIDTDGREIIIAMMASSQRYNDARTLAAAAAARTQP